MAADLTSTQNALVKETAGLRLRKNRDALNAFLFEGTKLFFEALRWPVAITHLFYTALWQQSLSAEDAGAFEQYRSVHTGCFCVSDKVMNKLSGQKTPEGILCRAEKLKFSGYKDKNCVILEEVQDPGNVGTILRTADAAGFAGVIATDKTADVYNEKVLRSAMGSAFHVPMSYTADLPGTLLSLKAEGYRVIGTALEGDTLRKLSQPKTQPVAVVLGNESRGMSSKIKALCDELWRIPIYGHAESLNVGVAAGIVLYDIAEQLNTRQ
jgi:TrmH family RNA methyltransferase